jgi:hypothetical protein
LCVFRALQSRTWNGKLLPGTFLQTWVTIDVIKDAIVVPASGNSGSKRKKILFNMGKSQRNGSKLPVGLTAFTVYIRTKAGIYYSVMSLKMMFQ